MLKIKITGINGYLGGLLAKHLQIKGHKVSGIPRKLLYGHTKFLKEEISHADVVINLAGASILSRWSKRNMRRIYKSRVDTTLNLVRAIHELPENERPGKIISASAIGIYKNNILHDENSTEFDGGFIGKLVKDWEAAYDLLPQNTRLTFFRIGLVIGKNALTIKKMKLPFELGLGGKIGSGKQAFPFIHEQDAARAFVWAAENEPQQKVYNLVAPEKITNADFSKTFANQLSRPLLLTVPTIVLRIIFELDEFPCRHDDHQ